ncbi:SDR family oxidoreductase [Roseomonas hellenica]|uniref:SDR family oxidoreductase n=1 Tax=Plastoroseomonas hellenica TaxID=2687306 RepID=A0ABS5EZ01_9PROT|nr:SDR family oxidoreductase [Plastoroseomonas hellenica]
MKNGKVKRYVVPGGAGFLGSHLCDLLLSEGAEVLCIDNLLTGRLQNLRHLEREPRFDFIKADISEPLTAHLTPSRLRGGAIFNLACAASPPHYQADPEHTMLTNVLGTRNLLRLAEDAGARFLLASTSEIYGDPDVHPQQEDYWGNVNPTGPRACYDEGKRAAETLAFDFGRAGRAQVRVARIFNTYGPRMRADDGRVVSNVISQALAGDDITIYGDGSQTRSFCYVDDLVDGLVRLMALEKEPPGAVNLGNPSEIRVLDLVARVLALTGSSSRVTNQTLPQDDPRRRRPDITRAQQLLNWSPRIALETGLPATIRWFAAEKDLTLPMPAAPAPDSASLRLA